MVLAECAPITALYFPQTKGLNPSGLNKKKYYSLGNEYRK
jgi:hypothetical protein